MINHWIIYLNIILRIYLIIEWISILVINWKSLSKKLIWAVCWSKSRYILMWDIVIWSIIWITIWHIRIRIRIIKVHHLMIMVRVNILQIFFVMLLSLSALISIISHLLSGSFSYLRSTIIIVGFVIIFSLNVVNMLWFMLINLLLNILFN